jgi:hypothetical protein
MAHNGAQPLKAARLFAFCREPDTRRYILIADACQIEPVRRGRWSCLRAWAAVQQLPKLLERAPPGRNLEHRAYEHSIHVAHEGIGLDRELDQPLLALAPRGCQYHARETHMVGLRRRKRGEVVRPEQRGGALFEHGHLDPVGPVEQAATLERGLARPRQQAVSVCTAGRVTTGVEAGLGRLARKHRDVLCKQRIQTADARRRPLVTRYLTERVNACVGPARHCERDP